MQVFKCYHKLLNYSTDITEYMILYDIEGKSAIAFAQIENGRKKKRIHIFANM